MRLHTLIWALGLYIATSLSGYSQTHQRVIDSLEKVLLFAKDDTGKVSGLLSLSKAYWEIDKYENAMARAVQARSLAETIGFEKGVASADRKIGIVYVATGAYPQALEFFLKSLSICERINDKNGEFLSINNIGIIYCSQKDYDKALEYFYRALTYDMDRGFTLNNMGEAYYGQGNYTLALEYFMKSLKVSQSISDKPQIATELNNIGSVYEERNDFDTALKWYYESLKIWKEIQYDGNACMVLGGIGDILNKQGEYKESIYYEMQSLELAKNTGSLTIIEGTEKTLSEIYEHLNDKNNALIHHKQYTLYKDSVFYDESKKKIIMSGMNFEFEKQQAIQKSEQDKKDVIKNAEISHARLVRNASILGCIALIVFLFILYKSYKRTQYQKHLVEEKSKEITDNINYASRIQKAMITSDNYISENLPENFVLYKPKDIVSGDWYWAYKSGNEMLFACADNTGHGSSGALLSMISISLLNGIVIGKKILQPDLILNALRTEIIKSLNQQGAADDRKDGMDISIGKLSLDTMILETACANNPLLIVRNKEVIEIKADRFPVGKYAGEEKPFTLHTVQLQKQDIIYTLTDGYIDQFGGEKGKKLMMKRFKEWICETSTLSTMAEINQELNNRFKKWIGDIEQVDDVSIFAIKV